MGLDMFIYRCSKPKLEPDRVYKRDELGGVIISAEEMDLPMYKMLRPYCTPCKVRNRYYNIEQIRKDHGLSDASYIGMESYASITVYDPSDQRSVDIVRSTINEKYITEEVEDSYNCNCEEEYYWRKEYDLQNFFYHHFTVENCGFYMLTAEIMEELNERFPGHHVVPEDPTEDSALFYHEWY